MIPCGTWWRGEPWRRGQRQHGNGMPGWEGMSSGRSAALQRTRWRKRGQRGMEDLELPERIWDASPCHSPKAARAQHLGTGWDGCARPGVALDDPRGSLDVP